MGVGLRLAGYFGGIELWWDEAFWAIRIAEGGPTANRPLGYVWLSRWLIELRNTEPVIRSVSLLAGILSLPVLLAVCRKAGLSRLTSLFGLFILAAHPAAIDLAREFKPYALELLLHLVLLWLAFAFLKSPQTWRLGLLALAATVAAPLSWSIVVLYPGLFTIVALSAWRRRSLSQLLITAGGAVTTLGVLLVAYRVQRQGVVTKPGYWGDKRRLLRRGGPRRPGVLVAGEDVRRRFVPHRLESFWLGPRVAEALGVAVVALCAIGVVAVVAARRWDRAALWVSPWIVTLGLNVLGWWPYGVFRTNLFLLAYSLLVALAGLDGVRQWTATRARVRWAVPVFCGAFVLAFLPLDVGLFAESKSSGMAGSCYARQALEVIYEAERDEAPPPRFRRFLADDDARFAVRYYRDFHAVAREKYQGFLEGRYRLKKRGQPMDEAVRKHAERGFWLLACKPGPVELLRQYVQDHCPEVDHVQGFRDGGLLLRCRGDAERGPRQ